jgi:hypothetical protein
MLVFGFSKLMKAMSLREELAKGVCLKVGDCSFGGGMM